VAADLDGDGAEDRALLYEIEGMEGFFVRFELSYGWAEETWLPEEAIEFRALNLGGPADLVVLVSHEHGGDFAQFVVLSRCEVDLAALSSDEAARLWLVDYAEWRAGVTCTADGIIRTEAHEQDGGAWQASAVTYSWNPDALRFRPPMGAAITILHSPEDDAEIASYADWDC
jgi:hypothetical protein